MIMKKRFVAVFLLFSVMISVLAGCGAQKTAETGTRAGATNEITSAGSTGLKTPAESQTESQPVSQTESGTVPHPDGGVIVVYFSRTGHTKPLAEYIKEELGADIYEIEAKVPYTDDDIKYYTDCRADREQKDPSARPEIAGEVPDLSEYDVVFLGYPIWHGQAPKIIYTFLESVDVSGKTVIPFCTSASSPVGTSADNLHPLAPGAVWKDGTRFAIGTAKEEISEWLKQYDLKGKDDVKDDIEPIRHTCVLVIEVNGKIFYANFEDNSSAEALKEKLNPGAITVDMRDYGGFEKVGALPWDLPRNDTQITTKPGDVILYQGNQITVYYDENTWNFTKLAVIGNVTKDELLAAFGSGDASVKFSLEWGE